MAITVEITGSGTLFGSKSNITDYSVDESITPIDPSVQNGGVGTIKFGANETADSVYLLDNQIELRDGARGIATGSVRALDPADYGLSITADSKLIVLQATKVTQPFQGTLQGAVTYYMGLAGVSGGFIVEDDIKALPVVLPGVQDTVLNVIHRLCLSQRVEMTVVYDNIVIRSLRTNTAVTTRESSSGISIDRGAPAQSVEIYYYNSIQRSNTIVYPSPLENASSGYQVDSGQILETIRIEMSASLSSVNQPAAVSTLGPVYTGAGGAYVVLGNDDLPIPAAEWNNNGGRVMVQIDPEDTNYILITITGMNFPNDVRAPYRVGVMSSGDGVYYGAMYITGTGVVYDKKKFTAYTGAVNTEQVVGVTIDDPFITSLTQAATIIQKTVGLYSGMNYALKGTAVSINRSSGSNQFAGPKVQDQKEYYSGDLLQVQKTEWSGKTVEQWNQFWRDRVSSQFQNQLFGNAAGARIFKRDAAFRIDSATTTEGDVSYSASMDVLVNDHNMIWSGKKVADYNAVWSDHILRDHELRPLKII